MKPQPEDTDVILRLPNDGKECPRSSLRIEHTAADGSRLTVSLDSDATLWVQFTAAGEPPTSGDDGPAAKNGFLTEWQHAS